MEPINNENVSLPEVYLRPSKKLYRVNSKSKGNIWKDNKAACVGEVVDCSNFYGSSSNKGNMNTKQVLKRQQKHLFSNEMRGETPGSDAPSNSPPLLGSIKNNFVLSIQPPEENVDESESDSFIWRPKSVSENFPDLSQRRPVEGADSNGEIPSLTSEQSNISCQDFQEIQYMHRNSPAGVSTPEILSNTTNTDVEGATSSHNPIIELIRPPALGQSEDIFQTFTRKDLGSTDGEDSSHESIKQPQEKNIKTFIEGCSVGSQSENTDSTNTVLDLKREPVQGCEDIMVIGKQSSGLCKPNFIVGGAISPRTSITATQKGCLIDLERPFPSESTKDHCKLGLTLQSSPEQDESLTSKVSLESTTHPESTECITSPSVMSVSSIASSKKLEWDSGADVGYSGKIQKEKLLTSSLSTLERIAIGNYASVLRAEPEGKGMKQIKRVKERGNKRSSSKEYKLSRFSESKPGFLGRKTVNIDYYSLNYNRKGHNVDLARKSLSTDEEKLSAKPLNSPKRKSKKVPIHSSTESDSEVAQNASNWVKPKSLKHLASNKKASSLCELGPSKTYNSGDLLTTSADTAMLLRDLTNTHNLDTFTDKPNPNVSNTLSLPSCSTFRNILPTSGVNLHQSQSLDFKKEHIENGHKASEPFDQDDGKVFKEGPDSNGNECTQVSSVTNQNEKVSDMENSGNSGPSSSFSDSINCLLFALSKKLNSYVSSLVDTGVVEKADDYIKLQDYINFVGMPSSNAEEVKLKKSVADIILRMFGDISAQELDSSSSTLNTDEIINEANISQSSIISSNLDPRTADKDEAKEGITERHFLISEDDNSSVKGNLVFVPYRPPSVTQTYYLALAGDVREVPLMGESQSRLVNEEGHSSCKEEMSVSLSERRDKLLTHMREDEHSSPDLTAYNKETKSDHSFIEENENEPAQHHEKCFVGLPVDVASTSKGLYQDWHGTYHVAHQPPGYSSCADSHQSESTSDSEPRKASRYHPQEPSESPSASGLLNLEGSRGNRPPVWSSTGSESAYETIREQHRNVGESLASSFEFYSTSPRDARLLGYVSDGSAKLAVQEEVDERKADLSEASVRDRVPDAASSDGHLTYRSSTREDLSRSNCPTNSYATRAALRKVYKKNRSHRKVSKGTTHTNDAESDRSSTSSASVIQVPRQQYVKRITKYISTLEKLEKTLMPSCENSLDNLLPEDDSLQFSKPVANRKRRERQLDGPSDPIDSSPLVGSESDLSSFSSKSSVGVEESSFVVHRLSPKKRGEDSHSLPSCGKRREDSHSVTSSEKRGDGSPYSTLSSYDMRREDSHSTLQGSSSERPKTSTLREESRRTRKLKKNERFKTDDDGLKGLSRISNFRKLMASNSVSGELRPYRFLLQRAERRAASDSRDDRGVIGPQIENNCREFGTKERIEVCRLLQDEGTKEEAKLRVVDSPISEERDSSLWQRDHPGKGKETSLEPRLSESLTPPELDSEVFDSVVLQKGGAETKKKEREESPIQENSSDLDGRSLVASVSKGLRTNAPEVEISKREFSQMFPSESFLNVAENKCLLSVSIQTGQSLLQLNSKDAAAETDDLEKPGSQTVRECIAGSECSPVHRSSSLEEMEARIKSNAERINSAITLYNKKFPFPIQTASSRSGLPKPPLFVETQKSFRQESDKDSLKEQDNKRERNSHILHSSLLVISASIAEEPKRKEPTVVRKTEEKETGRKVSHYNDGNVPPKSKKALKFIVTISDPKKETMTQNKSLVDELLELNKENEIMTLQEALSLARPTYVKEAEKRRMKICRKKVVRQKIQSHNQDVLAELPDNLKTPKVLQKFMYKPEESPIFSYKAMRQQNQRLYQMLPEAHSLTALKRKTGISKTNRVVANFYSKRLQRKALKGKVSHAHREIVTPPR